MPTERLPASARPLARWVVDFLHSYATRGDNTDSPSSDGYGLAIALRDRLAAELESELPGLLTGDGADCRLSTVDFNEAFAVVQQVRRAYDAMPEDRRRGFRVALFAAIGYAPGKPAAEAPDTPACLATEFDEIVSEHYGAPTSARGITPGQLWPELVPVAVDALAAFGVDGRVVRDVILAAARRDGKDCYFSIEDFATAWRKVVGRDLGPKANVRAFALLNRPYVSLIVTTGGRLYFRYRSDCDPYSEPAEVAAGDLDHRLRRACELYAMRVSGGECLFELRDYLAAGEKTSADHARSVLRGQADVVLVDRDVYHYALVKGCLPVSRFLETT